MTGRFQIEHKDGREYGLDSVKVFKEVYEPQGFKITKNQPYDWVAPEIKADEPAKAAKVEAATEAVTAKKSGDADSK
jgi:hypothetical protein